MILLINEKILTNIMAMPEEIIFKTVKVSDKEQREHNGKSNKKELYDIFKAYFSVQ